MALEVVSLFIVVASLLVTVVALLRRKERRQEASISFPITLDASTMLVLYDSCVHAQSFIMSDKESWGHVRREPAELLGPEW